MSVCPFLNSILIQKQFRNSHRETAKCNVSSIIFPVFKVVLLKVIICPRLYGIIFTLFKIILTKRAKWAVMIAWLSSSLVVVRHPSSRSVVRRRRFCTYTKNFYLWNCCAKLSSNYATSIINWSAIPSKSSHRIRRNWLKTLSHWY